MIKKLEEVVREFEKLEKVIDKSQEPEMFEYTLEKLEDALFGMRQYFDSLDANKFFCEECCKYFNLSERDERVVDEETGLGIYCKECCQDIVEEWEMDL